MNRYSSYSKSPLEWMGEIPSHWIYTKNRFGFKKWKNGKNESDETPVLSLTIKGIKIKKDLSFGKSTESYIGHQLVEKGDIVFTPRDFDQTPILSDVSKYDGCISNLYIVDKTNERVSNHYINYYWYGLKYSVDYFKNFSHGIRFSFNRFQFDEIPLLIPPLPEQTQIISFLDTKTQKIDGLIEKTEKKIELLKEKRTSLINHCVTKGLNPNVEMKDSGVEWIGEIPSGWGIIKGKYILKILTGNYPNDLTEDFSGISFFKVDDLNNTKQNYFIDSSQLVVKEDENIVPLEEDIILFPKRGMTIFTNKVVISKVKSYIDPNLMGVRVFDNSDIKFILLCIKNRGLGDICDSSTIPQINNKHIYPLEFPFPPLSEQTQIVEYLDEQTKKIDSTIEKETKRIALLKEYRQSLISEVVTGKIDVRDWKE